jgi:iron complex outermembrane recepter protein
LGYDQVDSDYESNSVWSPVNSSQQQNSYYAQLVYPLLPKLTATLGARVSDVEDEIIRATGLLRQDDDLTASEFGLNYQFTNEWRAFARYAESFRFANADENGLVAKDVLFLNPQTGESFEVGTEWQVANASVTYSLYTMTLSDEIVYDSTVTNNKLYKGANINLPDSERNGFMLDVDTVLSDELALRLNYTYTDAEVVDGLYRGKEVPFVAEHTANAAVVFTPINQLNITLESAYTGSRYKANDEANTNPRLDSLVVFNAAVNYQYDQWEFGARINNITNERYAGFDSLWGQYPQPERNYQASITYRF